MLKKIIVSVVIVSAIALSLFIYDACFTVRVAYIDIPQVFNGFEMKKELQVKYKKTEELRKRVLDSLGFDLQILSKKLQSDQGNKELINEFDLRRENYLKKKSMIQQDNAALSAQYDKQILEQMSQYVYDYGKEHNYDMILGSDGNGMLMFAKDKFNISKEIEVYINNKYKGIE
jgi:outer membrane protein